MKVDGQAQTLLELLSEPKSKKYYDSIIMAEILSVFMTTTRFTVMCIDDVDVHVSTFCITINLLTVQQHMFNEDFFVCHVLRTELK